MGYIEERYMNIVQWITSSIRNKMLIITGTGTTLLLASGTGFAPIKAIAEHIFHQRLNRDDGERRAAEQRGRVSRRVTPARIRTPPSAPARGH